MTKEDGGYYALKGFVYQFNKTIFEVLSQEDENVHINIEQEQDLDYHNYFIQVKYHDSDYTPGEQKQLVKKPTLKMLVDFQESPNRSYCLFIHFRGKEPEVKKYSSAKDLDTLLLKKKGDFSDALKERFIKKFVVVYAPNFKELFQSTIELIKQKFDVDDLAYSYHALISSRLFDLVVTYSEGEKEKRKVNFAELKKLIEEHSSKIVHSVYAHYLGEAKYLRYLKKATPPIDFTLQNAIFIGNNIQETSSESIPLIIKELTDKHYENKDITAKPLTFILDKPTGEIQEIKKKLIRLNIKFNDGYEAYSFSSNFFLEEPLVKSKQRRIPKKSSFSVRVLSYSTLQSNSQVFFPDILYIFGNSFELDETTEYSSMYFAVDNITLKQISEIL